MKPPWYSGTMRALGSYGSPSARVRILSTVRIHAEPLSNDELIELDKALQEAEKKGDEEEEPVHGLDIKTLRECLGGIKKALETLKKCDPNPVRSSKVAHDIEKSVKIIKKSMMKK
ncbi:hypothetical protein E2C01_050297 [Portunus trituberculatus]|uniref:Uncharacterized protein n=1 Tax=Portunus trituberculatus TaxID=210409 RepID=A0A5B7G8L6_PORTR|nr:hypothetical protein [Portunus trituberculatus]